MPTIKSHGSHQYKIKVLKPLADDESIAVNVYSPLTIQTVQIPIYSSKVPPKCLNQPFQSMPTLFLSVVSNFGLIISAVIVLSATIWGKSINFVIRSVRHYYCIYVDVCRYFYN